MPSESTPKLSDTTLLLPSHRKVEDREDMSFLAKWDEGDKKRTLVFVLCVVCGLSSGSNYVYSAYAPQLAGQLHLSSTQVNLIGTAGNLGVYLTGPLWGKLVDTRGQRLPLLVGGTLCLIGYAYIHGCYTLTIPIRAHPGEPEPASSLGLFLLCLAMFFTGCGGSAGLTSGVNAVAKSYSDTMRATMTGAVLAGFGLSAFTFSTLGHSFYNGDAGGLLLLLTFGTGVPLIVSSFFIRPYEPTGTIGYEPINDGTEELFDGSDAVDGVVRGRSTSLELARSQSPAARGHIVSSRSGSSSPDMKRPQTPSIDSRLGVSFSPLQLVGRVDFWILFIVLSILCGTGLMYINNAGTVALALGRGGQLEYDGKMVAAWQAKQVAVISIWNCIGRIVGGIVSDFCKTRFLIQRIWFLPVVALGFVGSQIAAMDTLEVRHLWMVSTLLGLSYGSLFNVMPMLILEWFGMQHFSQNWGWIAIAPVLGGNGFNLLFGRVYDSNTIGRIGAPGAEVVARLVNLFRRSAGIPEDAMHDCLKGADCYTTAFKISATFCMIAFGLSVFAGFRRERRNKVGRSVEEG